MKLLMILLLGMFLGLPPQLRAEPPRGSLAVGTELGSVTGVNAKLWFNKVNALDLSLGSAWPGAVEVKTSYLWHLYGIFHSKKVDLDNKLPLYFGFGGIFVGPGTPYAAGLPLTGAHGVAGVSYLFSEAPFDVFLELRPTMYLSPFPATHFQAGLGGRYYF